MTCRDLTIFLADYIAGELPADTQSQFEQHLERCPDCRVFVTQYKHTIRVERLAIGGPDAEIDSTEFPEDLVRAILKALNED